jgi:hypothetical protein
MTKRWFPAVVLGCGLLGAAPAQAQQRPLVTEDPETIGAGRLLIEAGLDYERDAFFPLSGLSGDRLSVPTVGVSIGVSSIAEIQIDGGLYQRLSITDRTQAPFTPILEIDGDYTEAVEDWIIGTKVRFLSERGARPAFAFRFATRLPNASNESGLGRDTTDFTAGVLVGKTIQSVRVVGNIGFLILNDPTRPARQDDLLTYGMSLARAISAKAEVVGEFNGRANFETNPVTKGAEDRATMRIGARYTTGAFRVDGGVLLGMTPRDPELGFTVGFTWVVNAFTVP